MKDPRSAPDQAHYLLSGSRVPELPHAINPMYGFCVRCLRTNQELAEHPVECWTDEYAKWVAIKALNRLSPLAK